MMKMRCNINMTFWSCNIIGASACITYANGIVKAPFHLLGHEGGNEVKHDYFGHVMPLALVIGSCDAKSIINGTIAFLGQDEENEVQHDLLVM